MSEILTAPQSTAEAELEREIRRERTFSMAEAIGRLAGSGSMKGASPITRLQQVQVEIDEFILQHLGDPSGALGTVLARQVKESQRLLHAFDLPLQALASLLGEILASDYLLQELVREADMEWGRLYEERPFFEVEGRPAHPEDPYTMDSVRELLTRFVAIVATSTG